jgi:hypothetical protein
MQSTGPRSNSLHRRAFSAAFLQVFGVEGSIDVIKHHGSTDPLIILNTLEYYGIPQETAAPKLPELKAKMVEYAKQHSSEVGEGLEILPGVLPLLDTLSRRNDVIIGLVHTFWILWPAKKNTICMHSPSLLLHSAHQSFSMILGCAGDRQSGGNRMAQNGSTWYTPILFSSQFWRVSNISWFRETFKQSCSSDSYVGYLVKNCTY